MAVTVLVVDDHEIVRRGLASLFAGSDCSIVAEATRADEAVRLARRHRPDVVLLDARLGTDDGLDAIKRLRAAAPRCRVVVFTAFESTVHVARAVAAGAHDYILKTASRRDLLDAVTTAAAGDPPARSGELRRIAGAMAHRRPPPDRDVPLTPRESQVLRFVATGMANKQIADALDISVETVKEHVQNLLRKLGLEDRTQAAVWAIRRGLG